MIVILDKNGTFTTVKCTGRTKAPHLLVPKPTPLTCFFVHNAVHETWVPARHTEERKQNCPDSQSIYCDQPRGLKNTSGHTIKGCRHNQKYIKLTNPNLSSNIKKKDTRPATPIINGRVTKTQKGQQGPAIRMGVPSA
jgi:hypothetical protein